MTRRPRIAFVVNHAAFFVSHRLPIALEARRRGYEIALFTGQAGSATMEAEAEGALRLHAIPHVRAPFTASGLNPLREIAGLVRLWAALRRFRPDLVHCASPKGNLYGGLAARAVSARAVVFAISGRGYLYTAQGSGGAARRLLAGVYGLIARLAFDAAHRRFIVQNQDDARWLALDAIAQPEDVTLIPGSGVDLKRFAADPGTKEHIVLFPARLVADKGIREFVQAAKSISRQTTGWRFIAAGSSDYRNPSSLSSDEITRLQQEHVVEFPGHVTDMAPLFAKASIVCLPSYREGMPKALLEASASGCAVLTTDAPGCREAIVPGETGDLVPVGDSEQLAASLISLIVDADRRGRYGLAGRQLAEQRYSIESVIARTMDIYEHLLAYR